MKEAGSYLPNIGRVIRTVLIVAAIFFIVVFTLVWFGVIAAATFSAPFLTNFFPAKETLTILMMINFLFVIGIPLVGIILTIIRLAWKRSIGSNWRTVLIILWVVNLFAFIAIGGTLAQEFVAEDEVQQLVPFENTSKTVSLVHYQPDGYDGDLRYFGGKGIELPGASVEYAITKSTDQSWRLNQIVSSRGKRSKEARSLAWEVKMPLKVENGLVASPKEIPFSELSKWRNQKVVLELAVPVGKFVRLGRDIRFRSSLMDVDIRPGREAQLYQMSATGQLICQDCETIKEIENTESDALGADTSTPAGTISEQQSNIEPFDQITLSGPVKVTIEYGEHYHLRVVGNDQDLAQLNQDHSDKELTISLNTEQTASPVRIFITTPTVSAINLENTDDVLLRNYALEVLDINASGDFELKADVSVQELNLEAGDGTEVEFVGNADMINVALSDASRMDTDRGTVGEINFELEDGSRLKLGAGVNIIQQKTDDSSSFRIVD